MDGASVICYEYLESMQAYETRLNFENVGCLFYQHYGIFALFYKSSEFNRFRISLFSLDKKSFIRAKDFVEKGNLITMIIMIF